MSKLKVSNELYLKQSVLVTSVFTLSNTFSTTVPSIINPKIQMQKLNRSKIKELNQILPISRWTQYNFSAQQNNFVLSLKTCD